ncbi:hypothetical protein [Sphaerisporangium dianthi]|uniref:Uncharacterized protein n=1 Tax=Sphaerisporangium dianthi TaxID=1436120 RepID=A0ABV9CWX2_9ACTN
MSSIEDRLRDALAAKAETVQDDGRPRVLPATRGRTARWWAPVAVAAAIVAVVAGTVVGTHAITAPAPAARPTPTTGPVAPPIEKVWPRAVHEIPAKGPGGRTFTPDVFVKDRVVVGRGLTRNRLDGIWSYDLDKRTFTRVAPLKDRNVMKAPLVHGDGYLAWSAIAGRRTEIWAVPVTGGVPRRIASIAALVTSDGSYYGIRLAIADGAAVWSPYDGGVYRASLKGGKATLISGTRGFHLVEWPWAGWPGVEAADHPVTRPMEHLKNVLTGALNDVTPPPGRSTWDECGVTWCFDRVEAWRRDGTGLRELPGSARGDLYSGRFVQLAQQDRDGRHASTVHDIATGRTGLLYPIPSRRGDKPPPALYLHEDVIWYETGRGTQVVVDLAAAGR